MSIEEAGCPKNSNRRTRVVGAPKLSWQKITKNTKHPKHSIQCQVECHVMSSTSNMWDIWGHLKENLQARNLNAMQADRNGIHMITNPRRRAIRQLQNLQQLWFQSPSLRSGLKFYCGARRSLQLGLLWCLLQLLQLVLLLTIGILLYLLQLLQLGPAWATFRTSCNFCNLGYFCACCNFCNLCYFWKLGYFCTFCNFCSLGYFCTCCNFCSLCYFWKLGYFCAFCVFCSLGYFCTHCNFCNLPYFFTLGSFCTSCNFCSLGYSCTSCIPLQLLQHLQLSNCATSAAWATFVPPATFATCATSATCGTFVPFATFATGTTSATSSCNFCSLGYFCTCCNFCLVLLLKIGILLYLLQPLQLGPAWATFVPVATSATCATSGSWANFVVLATSAAWATFVPFATCATSATSYCNFCSLG